MHQRPNKETVSISYLDYLRGEKKSHQFLASTEKLYN